MPGSERPNKEKQPGEFLQANRERPATADGIAAHCFQAGASQNSGYKEQPSWLERPVSGLPLENHFVTFAIPRHANTGSHKAIIGSAGGRRKFVLNDSVQD